MSDRIHKQVPEPAWLPPSDKDLFPDGDKPDCAFLLTHFKRQGKLTKEQVAKIVTAAKSIFSEQANVLELKPPCYIVGDIHGQYYDLASFFENSLPPPWEGQQWLFLGDYVDRGAFGCEVVLLLFAAKIAHPEMIHMLRGNHECRLLTSHFQFKKECKAKYGEDLYSLFMEAFDNLPVAATIENSDGKYLCVHAGLSPSLPTIDDINKFDRKMEVPKKGPLCDLVWSDPLEEESGQGLSPSDMQEWYEVGYVENPTRGCGYVYGYAAINEFLTKNNLKCIIRAHDVRKTGYEEHFFHRKEIDHPLCITLFSAPNYCDSYRNQAAIMNFEDFRYSYEQLEEAPHPYTLPNAMNGVMYSLPFVTENLIDIILNIVRILDATSDAEADKEEEAVAAERLKALEAMRTRVKAVAKMKGIMKSMREKNSLSVKLNGLVAPDQVVDADAADSIQLTRSESAYDAAKRLDSRNEIRPDTIGQPGGVQMTLSFWKKKIAEAAAAN